MAMMEKIRVNLYLTPDAKEWLYGKAEEMGMSVSALGNMLFLQMRDQEKVIQNLPAMLSKLKELQDLQAEIDK